MMTQYQLYLQQSKILSKLKFKKSILTNMFFPESSFKFDRPMILSVSVDEVFS